VCSFWSLGGIIIPGYEGGWIGNGGGSNISVYSQSSLTQTS
jgi:hypothetical protein